MWTVYDHPLDNPQNYVARLWLCGPEGPRATQHVLADPDLDALREQVRASAARLGVGVVRIARTPDDDPVILETWL
jgi:hypothetical protein